MNQPPSLLREMEADSYVGPGGQKLRLCSLFLDEINNFVAFFH